MIKADETKGPDSLEAMADDQTTKEPAGIVFSNVSSLTLEPFNVSSYYMDLQVKNRDSFDKSKYARVLNLHERNRHPHNYELDFDIYFGNSDEAVTLLQNQKEDGSNFIAHSSRLALLSEGRHWFNAHRKRQDETIKTLTSVLI